ncbi:hypothetical protein OKA04_05990 [Luteolibacter flavescens]|uniref:Uncharacterized protein n=1 Tax=Luteolibacter flavescens TaxID=1859460 RepID=A0ABT3FL22_9BACT|nr:hypothetical protein [Luteolibacter flavescens]MCW1884274.1 hypothetical protein [Luteolibacter flavescens]
MSASAQKPPAHPLAALTSIGGMSLVLAGVLELLGFSQKVDLIVAGWVQTTGLGGDFRILPSYVPWLWTIPMVLGLVGSMLGSRRNWRRTVLWATAVVLTIGWVPVLALAGYLAEVTMPLLALVWGGLWAMIYATRHQEPGDA